MSSGRSEVDHCDLVMNIAILTIIWGLSLAFIPMMVEGLSTLQWLDLAPILLIAVFVMTRSIKDIYGYVRKGR